MYDPVQHDPELIMPIESNFNIAPRAYTIRQFCQAYGFGRTTTYKLIAQGKLQSVRIGGRRIIPIGSAEALIATSISK